jgi:hypothetical protein
MLTVLSRGALPASAFFGKNLRTLSLCPRIRGAAGPLTLDVAKMYRKTYCSGPWQFAPEVRREQYGNRGFLRSGRRWERSAGQKGK